ncbi:unnamed protein product [Prorocentrum cordatum]|uniref:EF-hand domain-containing protein n=1 Tax=Prorocentrum cordatum TaxID=2364126 RepID=A0ABN9XRF1_9DINO|nr:unnamed protein product [Polarella glacialis]
MVGNSGSDGTYPALSSFTKATRGRGRLRDALPPALQDVAGGGEGSRPLRFGLQCLHAEGVDAVFGSGARPAVLAQAVRRGVSSALGWTPDDGDSEVQLACFVGTAYVAFGVEVDVEAAVNGFPRAGRFPWRTPSVPDLGMQAHLAGAMAALALEEATARGRGGEGEAPCVVVDPSCGSGALLLAAARAWPGAPPRLVGRDHGAEGVQRCRAALSELRLDASGVRCPAVGGGWRVEELPEDGEADVLLSRLPSRGRSRRGPSITEQAYEEILEEAARVLRPRGRCVLIAERANWLRNAASKGPWKQLAKWQVGGGESTLLLVLERRGLEAPAAEAAGEAAVALAAPGLPAAPAAADGLARRRQPAKRSDDIKARNRNSGDSVLIVRWINSKEDAEHKAGGCQRPCWLVDQVTETVMLHRVVRLEDAVTADKHETSDWQSGGCSLAAGVDPPTHWTRAHRRDPPMPFGSRGSREPKGDVQAPKSKDLPDQHGRLESVGSATPSRGSMFQSMFGGGTRPSASVPSGHDAQASGLADAEVGEPQEAPRQPDGAAPSAAGPPLRPRWSIFGGRGSPGKQGPEDGGAPSRGGGAASSSAAGPTGERHTAAEGPTVAERATGEARPRDLPGLTGRRGDNAAGLTGPLSEVKGSVDPDVLALRLGVRPDAAADAAAWRILRPLLLRPLPFPWQVRPLPAGGRGFHHAGTGETLEHHPLLPFFEDLLAFLRSRPEEPVAEALKAQVSLLTSGKALRRRFGMWDGPFDGSPSAQGTFRQRGGNGVRQTDPSLEAAADVAARMAGWHHLWQHLAPQEPFPVPESAIAELSLNLGHGAVFPVEADDEAAEALAGPDEAEAGGEAVEADGDAGAPMRPDGAEAGGEETPLAADPPLKRSPRAARMRTAMLDSDGDDDDRNPQRPDDECHADGDGEDDEDEDYEDDFEPQTRAATEQHADDEQKPEDDELQDHELPDDELPDDESESEVHAAAAAAPQSSAPPASAAGQQQVQAHWLQQQQPAPTPAPAAAEQPEAAEPCAQDAAHAPPRRSATAAAGQEPAAAEREPSAEPPAEPLAQRAQAAAELGQGAPEEAPATAEPQGAPPAKAETPGLEHSFLPKESTAEWAARALRPLTPQRRAPPEPAVAPSQRAPGLDRERPRRGIDRAIWGGAPAAAPAAAEAGAAAGVGATGAGQAWADPEEPPAAEEGAARLPREEGAEPPAEGGERAPAEEAEPGAPAADERAPASPASELQGGGVAAAAAEAPAAGHRAEVSAFAAALRESDGLFSRLAAKQGGLAARLELPAHAVADSQVGAPTAGIREYDIAVEGGCARPPTPVDQYGLPCRTVEVPYLAGAAPPPATGTVRPVNVRRRSASPPRRPAALPGLLGRRSSPRPDSASPRARRWPDDLLPVRAPTVAEMGAKAVKAFLSRACGTMEMAMSTFDPSGDGFFDYGEFEAGLKFLGYESKTDTRDIFNVLDRRQHHVLTLSDLINNFKGRPVYDGVPQPILPAIGAGILQEVLDAEFGSIIQEVLADAARAELLAPKGPARELPNVDAMLTRLGHKQQQDRRCSSLTASMVPASMVASAAAEVLLQEPAAEVAEIPPRLLVHSAEQQLLGAAPTAAGGLPDQAADPLEALGSEGAAPSPEPGSSAGSGGSDEEGFSETSESDGDGSIADLGYGATTPRGSTSTHRTSGCSGLGRSYKRISDEDEGKTSKESVAAVPSKLSRRDRSKNRTAMTVAQGTDEEEDERDAPAEPEQPTAAAVDPDQQRSASAPAVGCAPDAANLESAGSKSKDSSERSKRMFRRQATRGTEFMPSDTLPEVTEAMRQYNTMGSADAPNYGRRGSGILLNGMEDVEGDAAAGRAVLPPPPAPAGQAAQQAAPHEDAPRRSGSTRPAGARRAGSQSAGQRGSCGPEGQDSTDSAGVASVTAYPGRLTRVRSIMQHERETTTVARRTLARPEEPEVGPAGPPQDSGRVRSPPGRRRAGRHHRNKFSGFGFADRERTRPTLCSSRRRWRSPKRPGPG